MYWFHPHVIKELSDRYTKRQIEGYINGYNWYQVKMDMEKALIDHIEYEKLGNQDQQTLLRRLMEEVLEEKCFRIQMWEQNFKPILDPMYEQLTNELKTFGYLVNDYGEIFRFQNQFQFFDFYGNIFKSYEHTNDRFFSIKIHLKNNKQIHSECLIELNPGSSYRKLLEQLILQMHGDQKRIQFCEEANQIYQKMMPIMIHWYRMKEQYHIPFYKPIKN